MKNKPILSRIHNQVYLICGILGTPLEKQYKSALAELMEYEQKYKEEDYFKPKYQCEWIELEEDKDGYKLQ